MSIDQQINQIFKPIADVIESVIFYAHPIGGYDIKLILVWLVAASLFLTVYLGFINIRFFKHGIDWYVVNTTRRAIRGRLTAFKP